MLLLLLLYLLYLYLILYNIFLNKLKKYYRTDKGVNRKMKINRIRWNYRVCLGNKDSIMPIFVLQQEDKLLNVEFLDWISDTPNI